MTSVRQQKAGIGMRLNEYQKRAQATNKGTYCTSALGHDMPWVYSALALNEEAGEVAGKIKKVWRDNDGVMTVEKLDAILLELGDVLWYLANLSQDLGLTLEEVAQANLDKLSSRKARGVIGGEGDNR